jgi:NAD(P)-dependent dehydrogenase (short-subunit alcohol dehydrogenase family)
MSLFDLHSKVIVVLGGKGKIGMSICESLAQIGAKVICADQSVESTELVLNEQNGSQAYWKAHCDINSQVSLVLLIAQAEKMFGKIDAVVNCSYPRNQAYGTPLEILRSEDFCENLSIHVGGYFLVCQQFTIKFLEQGFGNIINFSSIYGSRVPRFEIYQGTTMQMPVVYSAVKAGIEHMSRYFAQKYKKNNIRVNCISPGGIFAEQDELFTKAYLQHSGSKGLLDPPDLIGGLVFLISDSSRYMTGQNIIIDDGFSL